MIIPKDWDKFQHYHDRRPQWIKLHKPILDDYVYQCLPVASRALAPMMWLLASEYEDGEITATIDEIGFRLRIARDDLVAALRPLVASKFFETDIDAIKVLATPEPSSSPEKRRGELQEQKEGEERTPATPAPTPASKSKSKARQQKLQLEPPKRPTRIPDDWRLSEKNTKHALSAGLLMRNNEIALEETAFKNFWLAKSGPNAVKMDWDATWHNWCLRTARERGRTPLPPEDAPKNTELTEDEWKLVLRNYAMTSSWKDVYGPPPGSKGCRVPSHLLPDDLE